MRDKIVGHLKAMLEVSVTTYWFKYSAIAWGV
jgi:hypothetical protein